MISSSDNLEGISLSVIFPESEIVTQKIIKYFLDDKIKKPHLCGFLLAVRTGLEPATLGVTGRYSNQLNYRTNIFNKLWRYTNPETSGNYRTNIFNKLWRYTNPETSGNYRTNIFNKPGQYSNPKISGNYRTN